MKRLIHASTKKHIKSSKDTKDRISYLQEKIDILKEHLNHNEYEDTEERIDDQIKLAELEEQLNFAWQDDEAEYNYALEQQEFNPDGSLKGYDDIYATSYSPLKIRYSVHWVSPDGKDCLLGGSNSVSEANRIAKDQAAEIFRNPWESDERKLHFLDNMYILDAETESDDNISFETEEYIDKLIAKIDSRISKN